MALAEIHGKMPFIYSEDLLTADVFAAFKYLPADSGILAFLHSIDGLNGLLRPLQAGESVTCDYHFWPLGFMRRREPDVLLEISIEERIYHIVVEAKYYSGPSDKEIEEIELDGDVYQVGNQLADQLRDLHHGEYRIFRQGLRHRRISLLSEVNDRFLIYLTAHNTKPRTELDRAKAQYPIGQRKLFWANWSQVYEHFKSLATSRPSWQNFRQEEGWIVAEPAFRTPITMIQAYILDLFSLSDQQKVMDKIVRPLREGSDLTGLVTLPPLPYMQVTE